MRSWKQHHEKYLMWFPFRKVGSLALQKTENSGFGYAQSPSGSEIPGAQAKTCRCPDKAALLFKFQIALDDMHIQYSSTHNTEAFLIRTANMPQKSCFFVWIRAVCNTFLKKTLRH